MYSAHLATSPTKLGTVSAVSQPMLIETSWNRSRQFGLSERQTQESFALSNTDLRLLSEKNRELMQHAYPVMETLHDQIIDSESVVVLTDAQGTILRSIGDDSFSMHAAQVAIRPGVSWSESQKGTNAIGTAIHERQPVIVHASQHFLQANHSLTCSATPIFAPAGDLLGILDVTGDYRGFSKHTMGLVRMSAQMIENAMFRRSHAGHLVVAFHGRPEFLGTLIEGLIAFGPDGRVISGNRSAWQQLDLSQNAMNTHTSASLFGRGVDDLISLASHALTTPLQCLLPSGVRIYAVPTGGAGRLTASASTPSPLPQRGQARKSEAEKLCNASDINSPPVGPYPHATLAHLDSGDAQVAAIINRLRRVADSDVSVLLEAETGAGKEWFSLAIHRASRRRNEPFIAVNCAAIPEGLIESELFGYEEGAFTGAHRKGHKGKIIQADGGTLFLDEIGDMPASMQARLLRVLQERVVTPLGGTKAISVDVRLVCATHHRLRDLIAQKLFRDDLYYRLNGLTVRLPPLRDRTDVREIINRLLRSLGGPQWRISEEVWPMMLNHGWPGNLRQLSNVLETAIAIAGADAVIERAHLPDDFVDDLMHRSEVTNPTNSEATKDNSVAHSATEDTSLDGATLLAINRSLDRHRGNISAASRELGISRNTLYRRLQAHSQDLPG